MCFFIFSIVVLIFLILNATMCIINNENGYLLIWVIVSGTLVAACAITEIIIYLTQHIRWI